MIRVGIGGWTYEPWRGTFYPPGLPHARELEYAAAHVGMIEINATFYRQQSPASFARWAQAAPAGFRFSVKASRYCTSARRLGETGESVARFTAQGLTELGDKLGPILWQFTPTRRFDADDMAAFLGLLPATQSGLRLRHAVEPRHESFRDPAFIELARQAGVAIVFADAANHPCITEQTADFTYARLQNARETEPAGYAADELDRWAELARRWQGPATSPRDVHILMINGAKVRAPAAAQALIGRLAG